MGVANGSIADIEGHSIPPAKCLQRDLLVTEISGRGAGGSRLAKPRFSYSRSVGK